MSSKLIIGNWKMHFTVAQAVSFAGKLASQQIPEKVTVVVAPHNLALSEIARSLQRTGLKIAAQNAYFVDEGAFTGEVSMPMLRSQAEYVLVGHSERRHIFHEENDDIRQKIAAAIRSKIKPILCVGETLTERQSHLTGRILSDQVSIGLADLTTTDLEQIVIAYEPVWAIGTGSFAATEDVSDAVDKIRAEVQSLYGAEAASKVTVLYGGSVAVDNAASYLKLPGVDGLLVGGASLNLETFWPIVQLAADQMPNSIKVHENPTILQHSTLKEPETNDLKKLDQAIEGLVGGLVPAAKRLPVAEKIVAKQVSTTPRFFDIVGPQQAGQTNLTGTLKTHPVSEKAGKPEKLLEQGGEDALLSEHASYSYNEKPVDAAQSSSVSKTTTAPRFFDFIEPSKPSEDSSPKQTVTTYVSPKENDDTDTVVKPSTPIISTGELTANNLVEQTQSKGHSEQTQLQRPTVFDTSQYHDPLALVSQPRLTNHIKISIPIIVMLVVLVGICVFVTIALR